MSKLWFAVAHFLGRWVRALHSLFVAPSLRFAQVLRSSHIKVYMWEGTQAWNLSTLPMLHLLGGFFRPALVWHTSNTYVACCTWTDGISLSHFLCKTLPNSEVQYTYPSKFDGQFWGTGWRYLSVQIAFNGGSSTQLNLTTTFVLGVTSCCFFCVFIHKCVTMHTVHYILCFVLQSTLYVVCVYTVYMNTKEKAHIEQAWGGPKLKAIFKSRHHPIPAMWVFLYYYTLPLTLQTRQTASSCPRLHWPLREYG